MDSLLLSTLPLALLALLPFGAAAEPVGEVDTVFKLIGPDPLPTRSSGRS